MMLALRGSGIYCESDLIARYSSWMEYSNDIFRMGWTNRILSILHRLNWSDLSTRGMYSTTYRVSDNMKDWSLMNLYMFQMSSPFHWGRTNLRCEISWFSSLVSNSLRSDGFSNAGLGFCELITESWFKIDRMSILTEFIQLLRAPKWLLNWNITIKKFMSWKNAFSFLIGGGQYCLSGGCPFVMT